jgi:molybdate transport system substrate-binding protein
MTKLPGKYNQMTSIYRAWIFFLLVFIPVVKVHAQAKLTVAVAANMQYASEELKAAFEKANNSKVDIIIGSSGKLTQQIISGAPFDVFISADTSFPQKLMEAGLAAEAPKIYAQGLLVLWSVKSGIRPAANLQLLLSDSMHSIALANPQTAPYGAAAEALLKKYNLFDKVKSKLVYGESITQTSQFIATQSADIGFTAKAIVLSDEMKGKGAWVDLNRNDYPPINQSAVLLAYGMKMHQADAKKFYAFLFSDTAKSIFKKFGYIIK